ncbi:hypothetical protein [Saccharopolyspora hordei]|uniref:S-DNA-T family DNA segregation ATPase FtsK/SpoIIIE n=1 Tax=Saccharopolyspora hordei TaxID=1838 RepID=A0A853AUW7_9PSEU|nr:hypothetical protein [Saccharopolyspora hordei]NYI86421.1 S-DNA-T family DNA segregation ATPase FtsK/SpoIIIE [Saccharopolyspora hordei]
MMPEKETTLGDLIRFPRGHQPDLTDGTAVRAVAERTDTSEHGPQSAEAGESGAQLEVRADTLPVKWERVPAVLAGTTKKAAEVADVAWPVVKTAGKATVRHGYYLAAGAFDTLSALYGRWTGRDIDAQIAAAQAAGEHGIAADLMRQRIESRKLLLERIQVWGKFLVRLPAVIAGLAGVVLAITLVTAVVAQIRPGGAGFAEVWDGLFSALETGFEFVAWAASWAPWAALTVAVGVLLKGYNARRRRTDAPEWMLADRDSAGHGQEVVVTADGIVRALKGLGIPALNRAFKDGWVPQFDLSPTREGQGLFKGYRARFSLPDGVPASMVADKRAVLAHNLHRAEIEVWPTDYGKVKGGRRGFIDLYVADAGVMEQPTPQYPLLHDGLADVFSGVPVGINQRGEELTFPLVGANVGVGGQPGQGKSNMMRVIFLGAALDPLAELRIHVFAGNGDFDQYSPRLSLYDKGADSGHVERAVEHLRELYAEIERREARLAGLGAKKLTRQLAEQHADLRPLIVGFSECHEMFSSDAASEEVDLEGNVVRGPKLGKEAAELAVQIVKRGRKTGIVTLYDTQSSRAKAIPSELVEQLGINACFYVKSWRNNDGFLGDGSFAAGIRATDLRFNIDRGTCVVTGISEELFEMLRTYYIEVDDDRGWDAATDVIARAMHAVDPRTPVNGDRPTAEPEQRDLLADLDTVLGAEPVSAAKAAKALVAQYGSAYHRDGKPLTGTQLVDELAERGVTVPSTGNKYPVDPVTVRNKLAAQGACHDTATTDDTTEAS